jgi:hypothetical protein
MKGKRLQKGLEVASSPCYKENGGKEETMCNGCHHGGGCSCGFGPPYLGPRNSIPKGKNRGGFRGVIRKRKRENWSSMGAMDKDRIAKSLGQLGLDQQTRDAILKSYSKAGYPIKRSLWNELSEDQQRSAGQKMMRALGLRQEVVEELEPLYFEIPLFRLQPPGTPKSKVTYSEKQSKTHGWSISVRVPCFATGADLSLFLDGRGEIETSKNECKAIVLPVTIHRYRVNLYWGKLRVAKNRIVAEAGNKKTGQIFSRAIISCDKYIKPDPTTPWIAEYDLLKDKSGTNAKFGLGWGSRMKHNAEFSIPVPKVDSGIQVSVSFDSEIQLGFDLEPRRDYRLYPTPKEIGITWKVSKRKPQAA